MKLLPKRLIRLRAAFLNALSSTRLLSLAYVACCKRLAIRPDVVLLESHKGVDFIGSPQAIARHILADPAYKHMRLVVVCPVGVETMWRTLATGRDIRFCRVDSLRYCLHLATAGWLVNDVTFPLYFSRRDGQRYLNTWHGTPLKTLGRRATKDRLLVVSNTQRNFLHATHLLAPNPHTEQVLMQDYMIEGIWRGQILRGGYPRNDVFRRVCPTSAPGGARALNVVFMPTWRGTYSTLDAASRVQLAEWRLLFDGLDAALPDDICVWVRLHPMVRGEIDLAGYRRLRPFPPAIDAYEHLAACDVLVTDYSSVLFDFAATRRPILLYTPDLAAYRGERDFCIDPETLPFTRTTTPAELVERLVKWHGSLPAADASHERFIELYCPHDDGRATEALCAHFFLGQRSLPEHQVSPDPGRPNVFLYGGGFLNNGITTSLKSLLSLVDNDACHLVLCVDMESAAINNDAYFGFLDRRIAFLPMRGMLPVDPLDAMRFILRDLLGRQWSADDKLVREVWMREYRRLFGSAAIDVLVSFEGYSRRVAFLMLAARSRKVVFMHNDMAAEIDAGRIGDPRALNLAYRQADVVAAVREGVWSEYCNRFDDISGKVMYVPNTLNPDCLERSRRPLDEAFRDGESEQRRAAVVAALSQPGRFRIVNLARFSPEKGQARLIDAFERAWQDDRSLHLYLIGAHGVSLEDVRCRAARSPAADAIFVVLGSGNPFPLVAQMDALVVSSFYEGLPMVLFEAFALGLPVVSTDIPGPEALLHQGYGLVVTNDVDGLVAGLRAARNGSVPKRRFDFYAHNQDAVRRFLAAAGIRPGSVP